MESQHSSSSSDGSVEESSGGDSKIRRTLGNLDALLGIEEDEKGNPIKKGDGKVRHSFFAVIRYHLCTILCWRHGSPADHWHIYRIFVPVHTAAKRPPFFEDYV